MKQFRIRRNPKYRGRPEDQTYGPGRLMIYGTQHILTMYGGIIAPPIIVGGAAGLSPADMATLVTAGLFLSGLATLLQTLGIGPFGSRLPIVQGISFASVSTMVAIAQDGGVRPVFGAIIVAGLIGLVASSFFAQLVRLFPAVVTGSVITVIGLSLMPVAFEWAMGGSGAEDLGSMSNIGFAGLTLVIILAISRAFQGAISRLSILIGMVVGILIAIPAGKADFSAVGEAEVIAFPQVLHFGPPAFQVGAIVSMTLVIFVIMIETTADIIAIGEIVGTEVDAKRVAQGLRADMAATAVSPLFSSFPCSAFAQNVGLVALTGIKSRFAVATGGLVLVVLGSLPAVGAIVSAIPLPVLGGAGVVLFGSVAASGIRTLSRVDYRDNLNMVIVSVAIAVGIIPVAAPDFWEAFPSWFSVVMDSGISATAVVAILLNLLFNEIKAGNRPGPSVFAAAENELDEFGDSLDDELRGEQQQSPRHSEVPRHGGAAHQPTHRPRSR